MKKINIAPNLIQRKNSRASGISKTRVAANAQSMVDVSLNSNDFVFAQCSIVASVNLEPNSYLITPETSKFVNSNGDCFPSPVLAKTYGSFIGGWNFVNHVQEPDKSVGFLADAVLRRRYIDRDANPTFIYYVDIMVATHRDHESLVRKLLTGEIEYMSMGCNAFQSTCSRCGYQPKDLSDETDTCEHLNDLSSQRNKTFMDDRGEQRIIADILGDNDPDSIQFEEASWLTEVPAFGGAARRNIIPMEKNTEVILKMPESTLQRPAMQKYLKLD